MENFSGNPVNNDLLQQYDKQKHRGTQGFGIFDGQELNMVHEANENQILKWLVKYDSNLLLMHHRFPTSTINVKRAAHPFSTKDYFNKSKRKKDQVQYILVHNGSIRNAEELYNKHFDMDIDYYSVLQDQTFNDSEALLWDFALYAEGKQKELTAKGGIAFICLKLEAGKLSKMYFARNYSSPLKMIRTKEGISLASELEGGENIDTDTLYTWNYKLKRLTTKKLEIPTPYTTTVYTGNYTAPSYPASSYAGSYSTLHDCNCNDVGWKNCEYHGIYDNWEDTDEEYWRNYEKKRNDKRLGEKLGNVLSRQFGDKFHQARQSDLGEVLTEEQTRRRAESKLITFTDPIDAEEITQEYMAYLASTKGHFESAYWSIEADYGLLLEAPNTKENIRKRRLLEFVMERIETDPEYVSQDARSNVWEVLWKQKS
jgi:predicted glutamine amidotransferase